jgi:hypothetical protein
MPDPRKTDDVGTGSHDDLRSGAGRGSEGTGQRPQPSEKELKGPESDTERGLAEDQGDVQDKVGKAERKTERDQW